MTGEGRAFLVEKVDYPDIVNHLLLLPQMAAATGPNLRPDAVFQANRQIHLPGQPKGAPGKWSSRQVAQAIPRRAGFVLDYTIVNGTQTDYVFQGDTTYYVTNTVQLNGTTTIEGGAVIKFGDPIGTLLQLNLNGPLICQTAPYHPAIITAKSDDSVGETISGSSGSPSGTYGYYALAFKDNGTTYDCHDIFIRHAYYAMVQFSSTDCTFYDIQIGDVVRAFALQPNAKIKSRNFLVHDATYGYYIPFGSGITLAGEHGTMHRVINLLNSPSYTVNLTNTLLISVTNNMSYAGENIETNHTDTGIFETAAAGSYYLATNIYRNAGTTNVNSDLVAALATQTTYAPTLLTADLHVDTVLDRQVARDTDTPDLGYHYEPLDYIAQSVSVSNAVLTLTNAATLGVDFDGTNFGILLDGGAHFISRGYADDLSRIVCIHAVQEGEPDSGSDYVLLADAYLSPSGAQIDLEFAHIPLMASSYFRLFEKICG